MNTNAPAPLVADHSTERKTNRPQFCNSARGSRILALTRNGWVLAASVCCATAPALATVPDQECGERVSLADLIARPDAYEGKAVWVVANVAIGLENMSACPSESERQSKSCLWISIDDAPHKTAQDYANYQSRLETWNRFNLQTVAMHATFDSTEKGHFGMWPGSLRNVTEVSGHQSDWSFTANAARPRNSCAGELPEETSEQKVRSGDNEGAIAGFTRAIELDPGNTGNYLMRAYARKQMHDYAGAIADYTRAIELEKEVDQGFLLILRAGISESTGDVDGAITDYSRAIELDPGLQSTYRSRGLLKQKKGDSKGAAADFARARQPIPEH